MTQIKKFGLGGLVAALFATMAAATLLSTAYAAVDSLATSNVTRTPGTTATLTATLDAEPADADTVEWAIVSTTGGVEAGLGDDEDQTLECTIDDVDNDLTVGDCDSGTAEADITGEAVTGVSVSLVIDDDSPAGSVTVVASHGTDVGKTITVYVVEGASEVDDLEVGSAPASVNQGDEDVTVTIVAVDDDGDPVSKEEISVQVESGAENFAATTVETDKDGEAEFEFDVEDDADGVVLTFYTGTGDFLGGDKFLTVAIPIAGDAETIELEVGAVAAGGTSKVTATVLDEDENPVPDAGIDFIASAGSVLACDENTDDDGVAECTFVAPTTTGTVVQITAVSAGAVGTATVTVGATAPGEEGEGTFVAPPVFGANGVGSAVFNGGTIEQLSAAVTAAGGTAVWVQGDDGNWYRYNTLATGATAFVNNAFIAEFAAGLGTTAVFVVE